jgi:hypothetical protein
MDDPHSQFTTDGHDWMGVVSATGDKKVTATWIGVDRGYDEKNPCHRIMRAVCQPASAVYFDSIIYDMDASKDFISRPLVNDTKSTNLYTISAYKISRRATVMKYRCPVRAKTWSGRRCSSPYRPKVRNILNSIIAGLKMTLSDIIGIFKETPVTVFLAHGSEKMAVVPSVSMSTILIVRPRKTRFQYEINEATGTIKNTGNTYFRVILQKGCNGDDESSTQFYMLPGESWTGPKRIVTGNILSH